MNKFVRIGLIAVVVASVLAPLFVPRQAVAADEGLHLVISPLPIDLSVPPGKTVTTDLKVKQTGTKSIKLKVTLYKFTAYGDEGKPRILDRAPGDDYFDWVTFDRTVFDAPPNVWQTVKMTITVPKSAAFGYYFAPAFSRADAPAATGQQNALNGGTAIMVLLDAINPNAKREMQLASFTAEHKIVEFLPDRFFVKLHNSGNVHGVPHGSIFITRGKKQIGIVNFNGEQGNILPGTNRIYFNDWTDGFPSYQVKIQNGAAVRDRKGQPVRVLKWDLGSISKIRFGLYTARLLAVYDDGKRDVPMEASVSFWVVPWRALLIALVLLTLAGLGIFFSGRGIYRMFKRRRRGRR